jgi:hypothetical protein
MRETLAAIIRQPEYTGENRCTPCTVLNLAIAGGLGAVVARRSRLGGALTVGVSVATIYLRGYLVPGTPELTKRYLPAPVLRAFGKESEAVVHGGLGAVDEPIDVVDDSDSDDREVDDAPSAAAVSEAEQPLNPETYFLEFNVVEPCEVADDLCLTDAFESAWNAEIDRIDAADLDADDAAAALGFDAADHDFEIGDYGGNARTLRQDGQLLGKWPSQAALVADVTAARVLEARDDHWNTYEPAAKGELLNGLRLFLETCPTSGGEVVIGEETVESCCRSHDVIAVTCAETGERLFEHPVSDLDIER